MVNPKPGLRERAAALLQFIRARELVDRGHVREVRGVAGHRVHAGDAGTHQLRHLDAVARTAVDDRAAEPNRFDHAECGRVEDVLREHFLVRGEAARRDDHLLRADEKLVALGVHGFDAADGAVFDDQLLRGGLREEFPAAGLDVVDEALDHFSGAAHEEVPRHERFFRTVHRADAAEFDAHVLDFVNGAFGLFNEDAQHGGIAAEVVVLKRRVQNLLDGGLDAVFFLVAGVDAQRAFGEKAGAAQELELFENERLHALVHRGVRGGEAGEAAADDEVDVLLLDRGERGRNRARHGRGGSGGAEELATVEFHGVFSSKNSGVVGGRLRACGLGEWSISRARTGTRCGQKSILRSTPAKVREVPHELGFLPMRTFPQDARCRRSRGRRKVRRFVKTGIRGRVGRPPVERQ